MSNNYRRLRVLACSVVSACSIAAASAAQAQYKRAPLLEQPVSVVQQLSIQLIDARARVLLQSPDALQHVIGDIHLDLLRVSATLRNGHAVQVAQLTDAVAALNHADSDDQIQLAATSIIEAVNSLKHNTDDAATNAAVAALLLVSESGLAEAFEEAVAGDDDSEDSDSEDNGEHEQSSKLAEPEDDTANIPYLLAYQLLQAVHKRLDNLPSKKTTNRDRQELLARLNQLLPTAQVPDTLSVDPEAAEEIAQALVGVLERQVQADLYFDRDLQKAIGIVSGMTARACELPMISGHETVLISQFHFENSLEATLSVLAAEMAQTIEDTYTDIIRQGSMTAAQCDALTDSYTAVAQLLFPGSVQQLSGQNNDG